MSDGYEIEIDCHKCGKQHRVPLDASGHFRGTLPCDPDLTVDLQVSPEKWRELMQAQAEKRIH